MAVPSTARADALVELPSGSASRAAALGGVELTGHGARDRVGAVASTAGLQALRAAGIAPRITIADLAAADRADRAADAAYARQSPGGSPLPSGRTGYRRLADYDADLTKLAAEHPDLVKPIELAPRSLLGRAIRGVEITHDVQRADGKPVVLQLGLHHAREWPSGESAMELAFDLALGDGRDPRITALLDRVRVIVVPVVNPDGFDVSRESPIDPQDPVTTQPVGLVQNGTAYRRKNCRAGGGSDAQVDCAAAPGVDLNRNYGIHWGGNGASSYEPSPDFRGAGPFSEPESQAIRRLVSERQVTLLVTNHTFGDQVLRPPGVKSVATVRDEPALKALADAFTAANGYRSERSWELYDNSGTTEDWSYGVTGGFGYTFEIGSENFHPAYERAVVEEYLGTGATAGRGNREAYLRGLEHAADGAGHATLEGFAPPGRVLRVRRTVRSQTSEVCVTQPTGFFSTPCPETSAPLPFADELSSTRTVGADGVVSWALNPSSAPLATDDGTWQLTCESADGRVLERRAVSLARGQRLRMDLACGEPPCTVARALSGVSVRGSRVRARGAGLRIELFRVASGRRALLRPTRVLLARRGTRLGSLRAGAYFLRLSARAGDGRREVRRIGLEVTAKGRVRRSRTFARPDGCGELRTARLAAPAAGGPRRAAPRVIVRVAGTATVRVTAMRRGRTVARLTRTVRGGTLTALRLPAAAAGPRGAATSVRVTSTRGTAAARRTGRATLRLSGL